MCIAFQFQLQHRDCKRAMPNKQSPLVVRYANSAISNVLLTVEYTKHRIYFAITATATTTKTALVRKRGEAPRGSKMNLNSEHFYPFDCKILQKLQTPSAAISCRKHTNNKYTKTLFSYLDRVTTTKSYTKS